MLLSFRAKISLTIITVSMAITCVLSMVFNQQSARTDTKQLYPSADAALTACAKAFDDTMLDAYSACVYAVNDETLRQCIQQRDLHQIGDILDTYRSKNKNIDSISMLFAEQPNIPEGQCQRSDGSAGDRGNYTNPAASVGGKQ